MSADLPQHSRTADPLTPFESIGEPAFASAPDRAERVAAAAADLVDGLSRSWLWMALAHQDMRLRYRGSLLGPFWQTVTTIVMIASMGFIYAKLFHLGLETYLPLLTVGLIFWQFISGMILEGCTTFYSAQVIIQQVKLPFSLHVYRLVYRNLLVLAHNFIIVPIVLLLFPQPVAWLRLLGAIPAMALILFDGVSVSFLLGMISARFRDVPPIVGSIVQVVFFITPIFWSAEALGPYRGWAELNPIFAAIDVIRAPLLGRPTAPHSWQILVVLSVALGAVSFAFFARFRARIAFWV
jgi:ABC-type polysaccharide/polyol phosphate export permease